MGKIIITPYKLNIQLFLNIFLGGKKLQYIYFIISNFPIFYYIMMISICYLQLDVFDGRIVDDDNFGNFDGRTVNRSASRR